jgi:hypothetical protein
MKNYKITFFYTDNCEKQAVMPIAENASSRGIEVKFSTDAREPADVGVYCQHLARPRARFSVVLLHDMAQRHDVWPEFWFHEPWNEFDIGILPGPFWSQMWKEMKHHRAAQPRIGVFELGWPKADLIYSDVDKHRAEVGLLRNVLKLKYNQTITYAPSWENHAKQSDFVNSLIDLPVNLLLKQAPWSSAYPQVLNAIREQNALHENLSDKIRIVDPEISIMRILAVSDLLVSDESSVLFEASLAGVPSLAVSDWLIPDRSPPRFASVPFPDIPKTTRECLHLDAQLMLARANESDAKTRAIREAFYSNIGQSSRSIIDLIDGILTHQKLVLPALT